MTTHKLANIALKAALRCSVHSVSKARKNDAYSDAVESEIDLIYAAMDCDMPSKDRERAKATIKQLMRSGCRYSFSEEKELAA